ncbi:YkuS family protein [Clostridium sp. JS66]|uniref:YkuS family protein n=1 Tax=Clostridium sp. JS66 TaxID=3064705 RepID=UPI00298E6237|nr:YkuS family protein [Clostridium sp. JS66]WPC41128.1 YkuS family protein [Clostridium sp. JS66]
MKKIGVEQGLSRIAEYLSSQGYSVETLSGNFENNTSKYENLDVIVTADYNTDMMGFSDTSTKVPVVNASGLTQEEVKSMIEQKITRS